MMALSSRVAVSFYRILILYQFHEKKIRQKNSVKITTLNFTKNIGKFVKITPSISRKYVKKVRQNYTFYFTKKYRIHRGKSPISAQKIKNFIWKNSFWKIIFEIWLNGTICHNEGNDHFKVG